MAAIFKHGAHSSPSFMPLRHRFALFSGLGLTAIFVALSVSLYLFQKNTIRQGVKELGLSISRSLAAAAISDLVTYNYISLERLADQAAKNPLLVYVVIHDKEGTIAAYSGHPELLQRHLNDSVTLKALGSDLPVTQEFFSKDHKEFVFEMAIPVNIPRSSERWGTVRVGLSLAPMARQIRLTQLVILMAGLLALGLAVFGSYWTARRITSPIEQLAKASKEVALGNLKTQLPMGNNDEVEILARNFNEMAESVLNYQSHLEDKIHEVEWLHQYTKQVLSVMNDGLLSFSLPDLQVLSINPAACITLDAQGNGLGDLYQQDILSDAHPLITFVKGLRDEPQGLGKQTVLQLNGSRFVLASGSLLSKADGDQELIVTMQDITELRALEARLRHAERLSELGTLAAGLAHEIRNPLTAIKTFIQLVPSRHTREGFLDKFQRTVPREIQRIDTLVERLLELARPTAYDFKALDLHFLLVETKELFIEQCLSQQVGLTLESTAGTCIVRADVEQLRKVFNNLIINALQAMPDGGQLRIVSKTDNSVAQMRFIDNGHGISSDAQGKLFHPFFTTKKGGTGLGLAAVHKIIVDHDGTIDVQSAPGKGSTFTVVLPLVYSA